MSFNILRVWWFFVACALAQHANISNGFNATLTSPISRSSAIDPILSCDREWASYSKSSILAYKPTSEVTMTKVTVYTETVYQTTYTCSSTCGSVCYADVTTTDSTISEITSTQTEVSTKWAKYNGTAPTCTIPSTACKSIWEVWSQSTSVWNTWYNNMGPPESEPPWPYATPGCKHCSQTGCWIQGSGKLQLYYWPVPTTVARDMCTDFPTKGYFDPWQSGKYSNTSYTPITTGPSTVIDGNTYYQGNVYLSIPLGSVTDNCRSTLGGVHSNILLTLASTDIYTNRNDKLGIYPIDYADFNTPYPWSAYKGALQDCLTGMNIKMGPWCTRSVVFQDQFHPIVQLPISMQWVDPAWSGCTLAMALRDPPVALSPVSMVITKPAAAPAQTTPALPPSSPKAVATQTKASDPGRAGHRPGKPEHGDPEDSPRPSGTAGIQNSPTTPIAPVVTIGPTILPLDPNGGGLIIDPGTTIQKGGTAVTISGTTISIGDRSVTLRSPAGVTSIPIGSAGSSAHITVGFQELNFDSAGNLLAVGVTLKQGDPAITIAGSVVSMGVSGILITNPGTGVIKSISLSSLQGMQVINVGDQALTIDPAGNLVLHDGKTLHIGDPAITISGTVISIGTAGVVVTGPTGSTSYIDKVGLGNEYGAGGISVASSLSGASQQLNEASTTSAVQAPSPKGSAGGHKLEWKPPNRPSFQQIDSKAKLRGKLLASRFCSASASDCPCDSRAFLLLNIGQYAQEPGPARQPERAVEPGKIYPSHLQRCLPHPRLPSISTDNCTFSISAG
ncbi:uncharacterized protein BDR25DRAFT_313811 [Lindgomyces ingoldianus]|uniref:Uncharacterized protein n=1 Tax=Lindgomyces ingoldianus TaxID=673940 RepID=A0ACB6QYA3_9PLEO|nr:uncharacterized protein BDR25DRAFT_313811 [Lindgomyces ingoldianus]KAF2471186.1 hypothetical protein BDR25DRAFT_313811 [Lindgomyces ingoldianus]